MCTGSCLLCPTPCKTSPSAPVIAGLECMYPVDLSTATVHVSYGNGKIGRIVNSSQLPGAGIITRRDGRVLTNVTGTCAGCCESCELACYARKSLRYPSVVRAWAENTAICKADPELYWNSVIVDPARKGRDLNRINVSGEWHSVESMLECFKAARKAAEFGAQVFGYSKRWDWLEDHISYKPANLNINSSIWHEYGRIIPGCGAFVYDDGTDPAVARLPHCPAVDRKGHKTGVTCQQCRMCLSPTVKAVFAH